jgi:hypothetical protein
MKNISYRKAAPAVNESLRFELPADFTRNGTAYYLRMVVHESACAPPACHWLTADAPLIRWDIERGQDLRNLLEAKAEAATPAATPALSPFHYKTVRFDLLYEDRPLNPRCADNSVINHVAWDTDARLFLPPLTVDTFFDVASQYVKLNVTNRTMAIGLEFNMRGFYFWRLKLNLIQQFAGFPQEESDVWMNTDFLAAVREEIASIFLSPNRLLLKSTAVAVVLHVIFQFLAFEKEVDYWRKQNSLVGVSLRTIGFEFISSLILLINMAFSEVPLSYVILGFLPLVKHVWKMAKLMKLSKRFPFVETREEYRGETNDADSQGLRLLLCILVPLLIVYAGYQLVYEKHKGVWSYIIDCAAKAVYAFEFLSLLPQLYVNYRLKTVAGMSRAALAYKFLNTFIDDMYTFLSNLPFFYKMLCFRDDVVFVCWAFQCCIYPVDPTRPNEFGITEAEARKEGSEKALANSSAGKQKTE